METIYKQNLFQGKTALITGGGTGIGLRIARELSTLGATVILASRSEEKLNKGVETIENDGRKVISIPLDIRNIESVQNCFSKIKEKVGECHILINNAGGQFPSLAKDINQKGWKAVIDTNLNGTFSMCQEALHSFFKESGGAIVNIIANIWNGFPYMAHTGAARAGVENLTKTLSIEWAKYGVRVNAIAPGVINSSGLQTYEEPFRSGVQMAKEFNLTGRLGTEAEVASACLFLLSPGAQYITGTTLRVDGGESVFHPFMPPSPHGKLEPILS